MIELADNCPVCHVAKLTVPRPGRIGCLRCDWSIDGVPSARVAELEKREAELMGEVMADAMLGPLVTRLRAALEKIAYQTRGVIADWQGPDVIHAIAITALAGAADETKGSK